MEFIKHHPEIQVRTSRLDTYLSCPRKSQIPSDMDVFTSYIGKLLHYSHQSPDIADNMVYLFMDTYNEVLGENDNELRDMLLKYVDKWRQFIEDTKDKKKYYEVPIERLVNGVWLWWTPDVIIDHEDFVEVLDYKTSKSPKSAYGDVLDVDNIKKAQPYIYSYFACLVTMKQKARFSYYVYSKAKTPKLSIYSVDLTFEQLEKIVFSIIDQYKLSNSLWMREARECDACWYCPQWPWKIWNSSCPLWKLEKDLWF